MAQERAARRRLTARVTLTGVLFSLVVLAWVWDDHARRLAVLAVLALRLAGNAALARWVEPRMKDPSTAFVGLNTPLTLALAHVSGWAFPIWFFLPLHVFIFDAYEERRGVRRLAFVMLTNGGFALWDGVSPAVVGTFAACCVGAWLIVEARAHALRDALAALRSNHRQLEDAHRSLGALHAKMVQQEKLSSLGLMAAGIAHEINNPMACVTSQVLELARELEHPDVPARLRSCAAEVLPDALEGIERVNAIVGDLRRFARSEPGPSSHYDLNDQVRTALRIASAAVRGRVVRVELAELPLAVGRPQQITQVLVNLLVNAGQATRHGDEVAITSRREGEELVVVVSDTGCGMTREALSMLFQPFHTTKPPGEGTGLGLSIVRGLVAGHGGRIEADSRPGSGSTFTVRLPVLAPEPVMTPLPGRMPSLAT